MVRLVKKLDFPVSQIRRYLEPGPIVLVSSALGDRRNIMTMGWHTVMEFTPSLVGCIIAGGNHIRPVGTGLCIDCCSGPFAPALSYSLRDLGPLTNGLPRR